MWQISDKTTKPNLCGSDLIIQIKHSMFAQSLSFSSLTATTLLLDLKVFESLSIHFVEEEVWQLLAQLVEAEEETLYVAELQFGLLVCRVLAILCLFWWHRHEFLKKCERV